MSKFHLRLRLFFWTFFGFGNIGLGVFLINYKHFNLDILGWIWILSSIGWFYRARIEYQLLGIKITIDKIFKKFPSR
ncbi:MAG: hypothetical protein A3I24_01735 [Candidatus Harrisonbacteria bacterium RIFCSPLOWO2_02_FULL_41_13b]|uniref:2TM domain-containing protein n=1 Tax=Candidatus Harrisonbacteria bacterium RIFCSPLOWO2_02_FULL_41_13b TaxID=1798409 RepID=A0A1G1ZV01_9BACT|nr:MAG: hypothetical protein A3J53_01155 [Candidatus Harrisonbacteria bacterium RIFCSPHIGHO2_02_FULL_40_20]OGY68321.1 MAG: hypothetical protein A3I24_01735 [Candidatus Harrisonbacteria bacterium RIFCSPLOWO2_02_FULL_41_13b]